MPQTLISSARTSIANWLRARAPTRESILVAAALVLVFGASYLSAFYIRSELLLRPAEARTIVRTIGWVVVCKALIFYARGICHRSLRALRFEDLSLLVRADTTALLVFVAANFYLPKLVPGWEQIPRSVILLDWAFTLLAVGGMQATARSLYEEIMPANAAGQHRTALVIDASPEGRLIAERISTRHGGEYIVCGLLDDEPDRYGERVAGTRVIGTTDNAEACAERLRVSDVVVRRGSLWGNRLRRLCERCAAMRIRLSISESVGGEEFADADAPPPVRLRSVEIGDLITHPEARLEEREADLRRGYAGRTVLVSGAGGTIGAEICRQLIRLGPAKIVILDRSEHALFEIQTELSEGLAAIPAGGARPSLETVLVDLGNTTRIGRVLAEHRPDFVIHAASLKHVAMLESHPIEAIETNVLATAAFAEAAHEHGVGTFVSLSTDKSVNPTGVMGASKLVGERFLQALGEVSPTRYVVVRLGNIVGSAGSVVPTFARRLRSSQPVTVTSPEAARHFLTARESARAVLMAGAVGGGSATYVVDSGPAMPIVDLVHTLAFLLRVPRDAVTIRFGGLRPGEKVEEETFHGDEEIRPLDGLPLVAVERPSAGLAAMRGTIESLWRTASEGDRERSREALMAAARDGGGTTGDVKRSRQTTGSGEGA